MHRLPRSMTSVSCFLAPMALLITGASVALAQTPTPSPSPSPAPKATPKPAEIPDAMTNLEKAAQLTKKPEFQQSNLKPSAPLFNPAKEAIFTVPSSYRKPGRLKIGTFFPSSKSLKDATGSVYLTLGGSLDLPPRGVTRPYAPELYLDAAFDRKEDNKQASLIGAGVGFRYYPGAKRGFTVPSVNHAQIYFGAGVGAYFLRSKIGTTVDNATKLGGKLTFGADFKENWSIEGNYTVTDKLKGRDFSGPAILLAYRF